MINNLIGVSGKISSGKDLVTKIIQYITQKDNPSWEDYKNNYHDKEFDFTPRYKNIKFADKIKDITCLLLGCTREELEDREFKEKELGEEWWYWKLKVPNYNLDRNEKITLKMMFNTETEAWEYNDKMLFYNREVC